MIASLGHFTPFLQAMFQRYLLGTRCPSFPYYQVLVTCLDQKPFISQTHPFGSNLFGCGPRLADVTSNWLFLATANFFFSSHFKRG